MEAIIMSIQPKHLVNILNGKKTLEIRKSVPKDFKGWVYLYCTKPKVKWRVGSLVFFNDELYRLPSGEIKYGTSVELAAYDYTKDNFLSGKVVARFWFDEYDTHPFVDVSIPAGYEDWDGNFVDTTEEEMGYYITGDDLDKMCLSYNEVTNYGKGKDLYALHIKQLEIFDEAMELSDFKKADYYATSVYFYIPPIKAPQSYMYVVVVE